ncbi:MAG: transcriptional regulator [Planctomycetes bacterium]|nr:transcriptional regulator [Planctomycetota bacterium]
MIDKRDVADRFFSCHATMNTKEIAKKYGVVPEAVLNWAKRETPPWKTLKYFCDCEGVSWDWLLEGIGTTYHPAKKKRKPRNKKPEFSTFRINRRFFTLFRGKTTGEIAEELGVIPNTVIQWKNFHNRVSWNKLQIVIEKYNVRWDWLIDGIEPKYRDPIDSQ